MESTMMKEKATTLMKFYGSPRLLQSVMKLRYQTLSAMMKLTLVVVEVPQIMETYLEISLVSQIRKLLVVVAHVFSHRPFENIEKKKGAYESVWGLCK
jgi:hypothetical protein